MLAYLLAVAAILAPQVHGACICTTSSSTIIKEFFDTWFDECSLSSSFDSFGNWNWFAYASTNTSDLIYSREYYSEGVYYIVGYDKCGIEYTFEYSLTILSANTAVYTDGCTEYYYNAYFVSEYLLILFVYDSTDTVSYIKLLIREDRWGYSCTDTLISYLVEILNFVGYEISYYYDYSQYPSAVSTISITEQVNVTKVVETFKPTHSCGCEW